MNIVVCVKQVPEAFVGLDRDSGYVRRGEAKAMVGLADRYALELGLGLKTQANGKLYALSMGPTGADQALRQALAVGYDEGFLVTDPLLAGSDTGVTAGVLAAAIRKLPDVGLVILGEASADGGTAQTAPRLAEALGFALIASVVEATLEGESLRALRNGAGRRERVEARSPAVLSVSLDGPKPRIPNAMGVMKAAKKPLTTWSLLDLGYDGEQAGQAGSCTWVTRAYKPEKREGCEVINGLPHDAARMLVERLARKNLIEV